LYRKHVVFGKLIQGKETLKKMENVDVDGTFPVETIKVADCGELKDGDAAEVSVLKGTRFD
jgi:peptidyl-prolyl isomerase G (cyclophilin G)